MGRSAEHMADTSEPETTLQPQGRHPTSRVKTPCDVASEDARGCRIRLPERHRPSLDFIAYHQYVVFLG